MLSSVLLVVHLLQRLNIKKYFSMFSLSEYANLLQTTCFTAITPVTKSVRTFNYRNILYLFIFCFFFYSHHLKILLFLHIPFRSFKNVSTRVLWKRIFISVLIYSWTFSYFWRSGSLAFPVPLLLIFQYKVPVLLLFLGIFLENLDLRYV